MSAEIFTLAERLQIAAFTAIQAGDEDLLHQQMDLMIPSEGREFHNTEISETYQPNCEFTRLFHNTRATYRVLISPFGTGSTTAAIRALFEYPLECYPDKQVGGVLEVNCETAIVRGTYLRLIRNVLPSVLKSLPRCTNVRLTKTPHPQISYHYEADMYLDEAGNISPVPTARREVVRIRNVIHLIALDRPQAQDDLLGLQLSAAMLSEPREMKDWVFQILPGRVGRLVPRQGRAVVMQPPVIFCEGNSMPITHPLFTSGLAPPLEEDYVRRRIYGANPGEATGFHMEDEAMLSHIATGKIKIGRFLAWYPTADSIHSPNRENLDPGYYVRLKMSLATEALQRVFYHNLPEKTMEGIPCYSNLAPDRHFADHALPFEPENPIILGSDADFRGGIVGGQWRNDGRFAILFALKNEGLSGVQLARQLYTQIFGIISPHSQEGDMYFSGARWETGVVEPAGNSRDRGGGMTYHENLNLGLKLSNAPPSFVFKMGSTSQPQTCIAAVNVALSADNPKDPSQKMVVISGASKDRHGRTFDLTRNLREGMQEYNYQTDISSTGVQMVSEKPNKKHAASGICNALEQCIMAAGFHAKHVSVDDIRAADFNFDAAYAAGLQDARDTRLAGFLPEKPAS